MIIFQTEFKTKLLDVPDLFSRVANKLFNVGLDVADSKHRVVFHTLRHTFASWLAIDGVPIYTIKSLMGHKDITQTMRYAKLSLILVQMQYEIWRKSSFSDKYVIVKSSFE